MTGVHIPLRLQPLTENSLLLHFVEPSTTQPSQELATIIGACRQALLRRFPKLIIDCVPSYTTALIYYDFLALAASNIDLASFRLDILNHLKESVLNAPAQNQAEPKRIEIPVCYGNDEGPDLARLASEKNMSCEAFIHLHSSALYTVFALGFKPGFAYLGFVDERISAPRLATPRRKVPAGAVGIADRQTGVYPCDSPGGWNIIGRTPLRVFTQHTQPEKSHRLFAVGAQVKFTPISAQEFQQSHHE